MFDEAFPSTDGFAMTHNQDMLRLIGALESEPEDQASSLRRLRVQQVRDEIAAGVYDVEARLPDALDALVSEVLSDTYQEVRRPA